MNFCSSGLPAHARSPGTTTCAACTSAGTASGSTITRRNRSIYLADLGQVATFWGRKNDAGHRVSGTCATEAIFSLAKAAREQNPNSKVVMIGHSFGALVMERSVAQGLIGALMFQEGKRGGNQDVVLPADLVLLLNSAAESIYAKEMIDFFRANPQENTVREGFIGPNRPLIVSVTSHADWYTGVLFGVGVQRFPTPPEASSVSHQALGGAIFAKAVLHAHRRP